MSAVTGWEISIKVKLGEWAAPAMLVPGFDDIVIRAGLQPLDLTLAQAERAGSLDLVHREGHDRRRFGRG